MIGKAFVLFKIDHIEEIIFTDSSRTCGTSRQVSQVIRQPVFRFQPFTGISNDVNQACRALAYLGCQLGDVIVRQFRGVSAIWQVVTSAIRSISFSGVGYIVSVLSSIVTNVVAAKLLILVGGNLVRRQAGGGHISSQSTMAIG